MHSKQPIDIKRVQMFWQTFFLIQKINWYKMGNHSKLFPCKQIMEDRQKDKIYRYFQPKVKLTFLITMTNKTILNHYGFIFDG